MSTVPRPTSNVTSQAAVLFGNGTNTWLHPFSPCEIDVEFFDSDFDLCLVHSAEAYYQVARLIELGHHKLAIICYNLDDPVACLNFVRGVVAVTEVDISAERHLALMRAALERKLESLIVRQDLLATGDRELINVSRRGDTFWAVNQNGRGHNHLGKLWMQLRDELRAAPPAPLTIAAD